MNQCLEMGKRVIVGYRHKRTQQRNGTEWPGIKVGMNHTHLRLDFKGSFVIFKTYWSPESKTVPKLHVYLNASLNSGKLNTYYDDGEGDELTSSMAHISFGKTTILQQILPFDPFGAWKNGIRAMTEKLDKELDHWYEHECWYHWFSGPRCCM